MSVEEVENRDPGCEVSDEPYYYSFPIPAVMATPAGLDDLILALCDLMHVQMQQMAQTIQLQQQLLMQQMNPPAMVMPPPAGRQAPQPETVKIGPTLPTFDGSGDADDHMELFMSIADAEGWNDDLCKLHFYKTLKKTALRGAFHFS